MDDDSPLGSPTIIDNLGKHTKRVSDKESMSQHIIETYGSAASHYNREKTQLCRHLSGDISIKGMCNDYKFKYPEKGCPFSYFYQVFKDMKISIL